MRELLLRLKLAWACLRNRTVIFNARIEDGTIMLSPDQRGMLVRNQLIRTPVGIRLRGL